MFFFTAFQAKEACESDGKEEKKEKMQEIKLYHFTEGHHLKDQLHKKAQVFMNEFICLDFIENTAMRT